MLTAEEVICSAIWIQERNISKNKVLGYLLRRSKPKQNKQRTVEWCYLFIKTNFTLQFRQNPRFEMIDRATIKT